MKDDLSKYLRLAEAEEILITRHGRPAGVLIGFGSEEDWFEYQIEHNPEFLQRIARAREEIHRGEGVRLEDIAQQGRANNEMHLTRARQRTGRPRR